MSWTTNNQDKLIELLKEQNRLLTCIGLALEKIADRPHYFLNKHGTLMIMHPNGQCDIA